MGARKNSDIRSFIIERSSALFAEKGIESTGLKQIAEECDISKGTLYYYFPNREKLVLVCAEALFSQISDALYEWMRNVSPDMPVSHICKTLAGIFTSEKQKAKLLTNLVCCSGEEVKRLREAAFEQWRIMLELASIRMNDEYGKRFETLAKTILPLIIGLCATGADAQQTSEHIISVLG